MKLLIVSPFIDPLAVGEPRWCYDLAMALSRRFDSVIISQTPAKGRDRIADLFPHATVHEQRGWKLDWMDKRINALAKPNYFKFHRFAKRVIRDGAGAGIDCAHHFGPLGMRYPTPLAGSGIPYVLGPVGGSLPFPPGFRPGSTRDPWYYRFRDLDGLRFRRDPWLRASYAGADVLVGAGGYVKEVLSDIPLKRFETRSEIVARAPPSDIDAILDVRGARNGPVRLLIVSRLIFSKGVHYALNALAGVADRLADWRLDILGDGPYRGEIEALSARLGLEDRVHLHGHLPRARVDDFYREADLFLFPSIREPSGAVIFEAMSWGLPIVAADYGGPATHVDDRFGVRVPVTDPDAFVAGLSRAILRLTNAPAERRWMSQEALRAARERHGMTAMVDFLERIYRDIARK